ncbi:hypothetical protein R1flu_006635 [Riccia fluitans]|uniref:Uncharacterized protein n=1 Tax=Riccia fluitans TaxID=41844 RepID=A0ABD1YWK8_9MARC
MALSSQPRVGLSLLRRTGLGISNYLRKGPASTMPRIDDVAGRLKMGHSAAQENKLDAPESGGAKEADAAGSNGSERGPPGHSMLAPFTSGTQQSDFHPLVIVRSEGVYVVDSEGKKYMDALAGLWSTALGGNEKRLVDAATRQLNLLPFYHSFWNRTTDPALKLAEELVDMFKPVKMAKVFFTNSGSEANDTQVKLVWYYNNHRGMPKKKKFIAREKAYHGSTLVTATLSGLPNLQKGFDLPEAFPYVLRAECPHYWRNHRPGESEEDYATRLADDLEKLILREDPETVAAFIAEPVMGAGGVMPPPATYFDKVQAVLKKYDILLIADEVVCAFGRLGAMFGCEKYNIKPDLVSLAKAITSAYAPLGAVLVSQKIWDEISAHSDKLGQFGHGFTYSGHPVSCAVALEAIRIYKEKKIDQYVAKVGPVWQEGMRAFEKSPIIAEIRGTGLIMAVEFGDKDPKKPFPGAWGTGAYFAAECAKQGLLVRVSGDIIMMSPILVVTEDELQEFIRMFGEALKITENHVKELQASQ